MSQDDVAQASDQRPEDSWPEILARFRRPEVRRGLIQLVDTLLPLAGLWLAMYLAAESTYWLALLLAIPAGLLMVRLFIIFHDCCHGSFFPSRRANETLGRILGACLLTPFSCWRKKHVIHHGTTGNLDRRGFGDVTTLTVAEYRALPRWRRLLYRLYRSPVVLFGLGPAWLFFVSQRFTRGLPRDWKRERASVWWTNLAIAAGLGVMAWLIGLRRFLLVQIPPTLVMATAGVWLFYVQHQFEDAYWRRRESWDFWEAALAGSSHYDLPRVLHWLTGNIGFHHVHHLCADIPNYHLESCLEAEPRLLQAHRLSLRSSFRTVSLKLWDEDRQRLVGFPRRSAQGAG